MKMNKQRTNQKKNPFPGHVLAVVFHLLLVLPDKCAYYAQSLSSYYRM
jgi:hypothetical protein